MPMIQPEIYAKPAAGIVGRRANMEEWNTVTRLTTAAGIGFGEPVQRGASADLIAPFTTGEFLGITEADMTAVDGAPGAAAVYPAGYNTPVCDMGVIWGKAAGTCTHNGNLHPIHPAEVVYLYLSLPFLTSLKNLFLL
jgi:hypothetical protein